MDQTLIIIDPFKIAIENSQRKEDGTGPGVSGVMLPRQQGYT
jgi:hypothetical protein